MYSKVANYTKSNSSFTKFSSINQRHLIAIKELLYKTITKRILKFLNIFQKFSISQEMVRSCRQQHNAINSSRIVRKAITQ